MLKNYRRCVSCRRVADRTEFWRVVAVHLTQNIQLDVGMGRSAYLCTQLDCLNAAHKKNRLGRALKAPVTAEIYQQLWSRLSPGENGL
jgi:uncharacterized protein